jgi:hypothetical protein
MLRRLSAPPPRNQAGPVDNRPAHDADRAAEAAARSQAPSVSLRRAPPLQLSRKCAACEDAAGLTEECEDCQEKRLLGHPLQRKLTINEPGDAYEQEADRVADQVMCMAAPPAPAGLPPDAPRVQRRVTDGGAAGSGTTAPPIVHDVLSSPGEPLDAASRNFFELRFGHDFSRVRARAAASARAVNAHAYTVGSHLCLAAGGERRSRALASGA